LATEDSGAMQRGYSDASAAAVLAVFSSALFVGSFLLFWIEPMFVKMLLPLLGGAPGVWNTAMVFFQAALLAGYAYAHVTTRYLGARRQALLHIALLALALFSLPITAGSWSPPADRSPIPWIIGLMAVSIGAPFFVVAATAPLLQRWISQANHSAARDPYFLYGASNLGSIAALIAYPAVIEPLWPVTGQNRLWAAGYAMLAALIVLCALMLWSRWTTVDEIPRAGKSSQASATVPWGERFPWIALAFVPSSLLLGVTAHIVTDVVSAPLLWVIPLALYLLTFVIAFARRPVLKTAWMARALPYAFIMIAITYSAPMPFWLDLALHLFAFFVAAMVCHGELARRRPDVDNLTEFYLCMSVGGVLGGLFNGILAPVIFNAIYEYPLALVLACLLVPAGERRLPEPRWRDLAYPAALLVVMAIPMLERDHIVRNVGAVGVTAFLGAGGIATFGFRERPARFALGMLVLLFAAASFDARGQLLAEERSFFGVSKVMSDEDGHVRLLVHGTTIHGAEYADPARWRDILTYYAPAGPAGQFFASLSERKDLKEVGVIGLGSGALTCYRRPRESWTYFEIDPVVERLARDTRYFHFLAECGPDTKIVLGDARLSLKAVPDGRFDLLILDAFSSDAIPIHLLTREAVALYTAKLARGGILLLHISNRNLDLAPVVANLARDAGAVALHQVYAPPAAVLATLEQTPSEWVAIARRAEDLMFLAGKPGWVPLESRGQSAVWTDDYSNLLGALKIPTLIGAARWH